MLVEIIILFFILGPLVFGVGYQVYKYLRKLRRKHASYYRKTDHVIEAVLVNFDYYQALSQDGQVTFKKRVRHLGFEKNFQGKQGFEVTDTMRVQISASLVQLTFGYRDFEVLHFDQIHIYPSTFYHPLHKQEMKGYTAPSGVVALSWPDFQHGYEHPNDNYNLGLHELAHALHINIDQSYDSKHFRRHFQFWSTAGVKDFEKLQTGESAFLRQYGGTNFHEFFAVCVEHFFESPQEFYREMPILYIRTCLLLFQNPLNHTDDFRFQASDFKELSRFSLS